MPNWSIHNNEHGWSLSIKQTSSEMCIYIHSGSYGMSYIMSTAEFERMLSKLGYVKDTWTDLEAEFDRLLIRSEPWET